MTYRIVLDYGHGGSKTGAAYQGILEKHLNLDLGQKIYQQLKQLSDDIQVMLTRDDDYDIPIASRCALINAHHQQRPIDLVASIHHNAADNINAHGFEVYINEGNQLTRRHATAIAREIEAIGLTLRNGGVLTTQQLGRRLAMIHKVAPPAILIEAGYITNKNDRNTITSASSQAAIAKAIATAICNVLSSGGTP